MWTSDSYFWQLLGRSAVPFCCCLATLFFALTCPLAWVGVACAIAHISRRIDLLELAAQWRHYSAAEVRTALGPYAMPMVAAAVLLAILGWGVLAVCAPRLVRRTERLCSCVCGLGVSSRRTGRGMDTCLAAQRSGALRLGSAGYGTHLGRLVSELLHE